MIIARRHTLWRGFAVLAALAAAERAPAQTLPPVPALDTVEVAAGERYAAGGLHRFFFGDAYRDLWTTPIRVPVLDLERFAGGVRATDEGGGFQTRSLRLTTEDGLEFVVRSVDKDPSAILPARIRRRSAVRSIVRDQVSAAFPASALAIPPMVEAIGLPRPEPQLVVLPDHPRLGEWREDYAGMLGMLEHYPDEREGDRPGFAGATKIVGTDELFERLNESPIHRVDTTGFLAARLLDFVINDWDRHEDQWRWLRSTEGKDTLWTPVPRDRDQAFIGFDGLFLSLARLTAPRLVSFEPEPPMGGLTHNSRYLDRRLLAGLDRERFDSVAHRVQSRLTDEVFAEGLARLPPKYREAEGEGVLAVLRARRDSLPSIADRFYLQLADAVDVHATDEEDLALVERHEDGAVTVQLREDSGEDLDGDLYFERRFDRDETNEVRIYLHGDDDRAVVRGNAPDGSVTVRVIGGRGANVFEDSSRVGGNRTPTKFYDEGETALVTYGPDSLVARHVDRRPWVLPPGEPSTPVPPPSDFGGSIAPAGTFGYATGLGVTWGAGFALTRYGFRHAPFARRIDFMLEQATGPGELRATLTAEFHREMSEMGLRFTGRGSGMEVVRFHGLGNATEAGPEDSEFYQVDHNQYEAAAELVFPIGRSATATIGPVLRHAATERPAGRFIGITEPYGSGEFTHFGVRSGFEWNGSRNAGIRRTGFVFRGSGAFYPEGLDAEEPFGHLRGQIMRYMPLPIPGAPALALRAGGHRAWGQVPFFDAAFLGGPETLRGYTYQRFAGEAAAWGAAELRLKLFSYGFFLPGDVGVLGLADAGRVWVDGENDESWHSAYGGGIWIAFIGEEGTIALTFAEGDEQTTAHLSLGFGF